MGQRKKIVIKPAPLIPGETVGIAAPAGCFDEERFRKGLSVIEDMGFRVKVPEGVFASKRYLAGSDEHRALILNRLFSDDSVRAIICARGGFGTIRIAPLLDVDLYAGKPKILVGFSDISALLSIVCQHSGLVVFHGPVVTSLADNAGQSVESLLAAITSATPVSIRPDDGVTITPGRARGVVRGGNLASLCQMAGTPWQPDFKGCLLFLEEVNEPPYRIDRMLSQLRFSGCLDGVAGVALGSLEGCGDRRTVFEIVAEHVPPGVPVLAGLPVGHGKVNLTLPVGIEATLDADNMTLDYHESALALPGD